LSSPEAAQHAAELMRDALVDPIQIDELGLEIECSIGIALWPEHGSGPSTLLKRADIAMYTAKTNQLGVATYDPESDINSPRRLALATDLSRAIDAGELVVYYQPKARISDGKVIGVEALVRWN